MAPLKTVQGTGRHSSWYGYMVIFVSSMAMGVIAILVSVHMNQRSDERDRAQQAEINAAMCAVIATMDDARRAVGSGQNRPATPYGQELAANIAQLRARLCPPGTPAPLPAPSR